MRNLNLASAALLLGAGVAHAAGSASLTGSGIYQETFDAIGTSGIAPPAGWAVYTGNSGTTNATWTSSIVASGSNSVATLDATSGPLVATNSPASNSNNGFNAAVGPSNTSDRVLATAPTQVSGGALQLTLVNNTGIAFDEFVLGYETVRFTAASQANELPGYWLFTSLDGSSWTNVAALNPTSITVPNTVGVTAVDGATVNLGASVAAGGTFYLRWVDDNARQSSPDQIIGLNNVTLSVPAVPEPGTYALLLAGLGLVAWVARRRS